MSSVNKVILVGNLGGDPEVRHLESGSAVAQFRLATNETYKDKSGNRVERTEWHNIVAWRGLAEVAEKYMRKGQSVYVEGKIRTRQYQDKDNQTRYVTEIVADEITMLGGGRGAEGAANGQAQAAPAAAQPAATPEQKTFRQQPEMDELPF
ncbi:single-stranded DNA-binding protein [Hymenobacter busanensis]|uniref:Single-stranded DNA-binding protein n=1 Tax=Hymenobacter busanensis TaxID=2607656 RepID=A0A7L4ZZP0_9BACT|nr:single-stranded DNA-binding protein [Hymenobacter busanensis]KAA9331575.1 single-stranded DNA-binding protein [Hymenobacter busanensis]QHJ08728.1 single-stranded DNA-binding protein [Hymenobacter busanensis]